MDNSSNMENAAKSSEIPKESKTAKKNLSKNTKEMPFVEPAKIGKSTCLQDLLHFMAILLLLIDLYLCLFYDFHNIELWLGLLVVEEFLFFFWASGTYIIYYIVKETPTDLEQTPNIKTLSRFKVEALLLMSKPAQQSFSLPPPAPGFQLKETLYKSRRRATSVDQLLPSYVIGIKAEEEDLPSYEDAAEMV